MSDDLTADEWLAARITVLATDLTVAAEQALIGRLDTSMRHQLADKLRDIAQDVRPQ